MLQLEQSPITSQCHSALKLLTQRYKASEDSTDLFEEVLAEFMEFCIHEDQFVIKVASINTYQSQMIWSQLQDFYPKLSSILIKVYSGPVSSAGVERHHKVGKRTAHNVIALDQAKLRCKLLLHIMLLSN
jgi:hypothetical protein